MCLTCSLLALGREAKLWRQCFMRLEPKPHPILVSLPKSWTLSSCLLVINSLSSETCDSSKGREGMTWKLIRGTVLKWCCKMEMRPLEERDCTWEICKPRWKQRKGGRGGRQRVQQARVPGSGMEMVLPPPGGRNSASQTQIPSGEFLLPRGKEEDASEPQQPPEVLVKASVTVLTLVVAAMESWHLDRGPSWPSTQVSVVAYWEFWNFAPGVRFERNVCCLETSSCLRLASSLQGAVPSLISILVIPFWTLNH